MNVFNEEYDLSKCTPEEVKEVEEWYEKNKEEKVPVAADYIDTNNRSDACRRMSTHESDPLDIELAMESLKGNKTFDPPLTGDTKHIELYKMVHPLGGNMSVYDAAKKLGINKVTAYRQLTTLFAINPEVYDLHKWPTKAQLDVYRLIHPDLGGLTYHEAAKALKSTYQHIAQMMFRMRKTHPQAFAFQRMHRPRVCRLNVATNDNQIKDKV